MWGNITVNSRYERIKIVVFGEAPTWEKVPQIRNIWEEDVGGTYISLNEIRKE